MPTRSRTNSFSRTLSLRLPIRFPTETTVWYSCGPPLGLYDRGELFNVCGFERPCFGRGGPYRKTRGTTAGAFSDDTVRLQGSLQRAWLNSAQSSGSHCVWLNMSRHMRNNSVGTNDRVLKVSAVQAPCRIDPRTGFFIHEITNSFDDHQSTTPFTGHAVSSWRSSLVSLCRALVAVTIRLARPYGHPPAQFPPCNVCSVARFIRRDSLSDSCRALWNGFKAPKG